MHNAFGLGVSGNDGGRTTHDMLRQPLFIMDMGSPSTGLHVERDMRDHAMTADANGDAVLASPSSIHATPVNATPNL